MNGVHLYVLGPVQDYMVQDMIVRSAQAAGLTITDSFAKRLIHDAETDSANLPLLAFVLNKLFEQRVGNELSEATFSKFGGIMGATTAHVHTVEIAIQNQFGVNSHTVLQGIFQTLVKLHKDEGVPVRNRPLKAIFTGVQEKVVGSLIAYRLLRTEGEGEDATVSISHETLFEAWPALRQYVETHKKVLMDRTHLESRAQKWAAMGKPKLSGLATGQEYRDFRQAGLSTTALTQEFLRASYWTRNLWRGVGFLAILLLSLVTWLWQKGYNLEQAMLKVQSVVISIHLAPQMVAIPEGTFRQGDVKGRGESWRNPVRDVNIGSFFLSKHEVTFEEYDRFAIDRGRELPNDQGWGRGQRPVINVTWNDASEYAAWLSEQTGKPYRLPSESEWEYAARSGAKQEEFAGTNEEAQLPAYAVYQENSGNRTAEVGSKNPNAFGVQDMTGNMWEWVEDCWHGNYEGAPTDGQAWLAEHNGDCSQRVVRGGSWNSRLENLMVSYRFRDSAVNRDNYVGFRLAQGTR